MIGAFAGLSPVVQALLATMFTWGMTAVGTALVFGTKNVPRRLLDAMLGFARGRCHDRGQFLVASGSIHRTFCERTAADVGAAPDRVSGWGYLPEGPRPGAPPPAPGTQDERRGRNTDGLAPQCAARLRDNASQYTGGPCCRCRLRRRGRRNLGGYPRRRCGARGCRGPGASSTASSRPWSSPSPGSLGLLPSSSQGQYCPTPWRSPLGP